MQTRLLILLETKFSGTTHLAQNILATAKQLLQGMHVALERRNKSRHLLVHVWKTVA
jgi:hypothetical protein